MVSKTTVIWCGVGVTAGAAILGYCIYFDKKRRHDPEYKRKLREKRQQDKPPTAPAERINQSSFKTLPLENPSKMQGYFLQEVQLGEELLAAGDDRGIEHFCNAVAVCNSPDDLLAILRETLPPSMFGAVIQRLPDVRNNLAVEIQSRVMERHRSNIGETHETD